MTSRWIMNSDYESELDRLRRRGLFRTLAPLDATGGKFVASGKQVLNFSSNDYLDLANDARLTAAAAGAIATYGTGSTASRLMAGSLDIHRRLEGRLAGLLRRQSALVFGSGYLTNVGVISALAKRGDNVFADRLSHASILDGARLCGARLHRYRHNDAGHLEELLRRAGADGRRIIVSDSLFSMDGDVAPVAELSALAREHGALLIIDEAHALGVFGPCGAGICASLGCEPDVVIGTLSKALGGYGGFAACSGAIRDVLINRARSFIYSTALPPACAGSALAAVDVIQAEPELGQQLLRRAQHFRALLNKLGL
ncbi:MAG: 8-amino-7-oxononanoate synthase, partial [Planctomycetia bacterium]|nr:8-amino-7-oxononanoate synthase [Planctomycetia bacterium]